MKVTLEIPLTAGEIAQAAGCSFSNPELTVQSVCTHSGEAEPHSLFIALDSGENFTSEARRKGALTLSTGDKSGITVHDVRAALLDIAALYKSKLPKLKKTIAVTGSVGKTTVKDYTAALLSAAYQTSATSGNYNNALGVSLSILSARRDTEMLVLEMGMNHKGEIKSLSSAAKPDVAVITNVGTSHLGNLGSREMIASAKKEITAGLCPSGRLIIPSDEPLLSDLKNAITVGVGGDFSLKFNLSRHDLTDFDVKWRDLLIEGVRFLWGGEHFAVDLVFAVAAALSVGMSGDKIKAALLDTSPFRPRPKTISVGRLLVYDDTYNASLESFTAAFRTLKDVYPKSAVVGEVLELGTHAKTIHEKIGKELASYDFRKLYLFGAHAEDVARGAVAHGVKSSDIFLNERTNLPDVTAKAVVSHALEGELILVKGSRGTHTEKIIERIKKYEGENNV